jgi:nucleoside-diphosphate-sugar epimerase
MTEIHKVLVTGASGFLGSHIAEAAHEAGYEVHALIRAASSGRWLGHEWLEIHTANLFDRKALSSILKEVDAVIHNAGTLWGEYHKVNTEGTRVVAEESAKAGIKRFVYISSLAAGGASKGPYAKDGAEPDNPISSYGHSKKDAEQLLYNLRGKLHVVILRYPMIYGPRDTQGLRLFRTFKIFINPSVGLRRRYISVVYVKDAARAAVAALLAPVGSGSCYNISDGGDYTFNKLYKVVGKVWGRIALRIPVPFDLIMFGAWVVNDVLKGKTAFNPSQMGMFRKRFWLVSCKEAIRDLDWRPEVDIYEGIRETIRWYKDEGWL